MDFRMRVYTGQTCAKTLAERLKKDKRFSDVVIDFRHVHFSASTSWLNELGIECDVSDVFGYRVPCADFSVISHS